MTALLIMSQPGVGKTSTCLKAFGKTAFYVATEAEAMAVRYNSKLFPPVANGKPSDDHRLIEGEDYVECLAASGQTGGAPWLEVLRAVRHGCGLVRAGKKLAIVLDTISTLADREYDFLKQTMRDGHGRVWTELESHLRPALNESLASGAIFVALCHRKEGFNGGPDTPRVAGLFGRETLPSLFPIVLALEARLDAQTGRIERVFRCDPANPIHKDRYGLVVDGELADLRGLLKRIAAVRAGREPAPAPRSLLAVSGVGGAGGGGL